MGSHGPADTTRWRTFPGGKTLVVAARTVTSTVRVLESLPALLRDDPRIDVVYAHDPTSAFGDGVLDLLHDTGARVMPWEQLGTLTPPPDLILSASENIDVPEGTCPVLVLPHGIGFQKYVPDSRSADDRLSGLVPDRLLEAGRAWLAVSHPDQAEQLHAHRPKTAGHTLLVGDPCYDELRAALPHAAAYRRALDLPGTARLVVLSSTWSQNSLLGRDPGLPARLLASLPYDEFRVAAITHPNIWAGHGGSEIRRRLAAAREAGLLLVPPVHAWRSVLPVADLVIGDHGSVTLYGAALGRPVLLGAFGAESVPGTAAAALGARAPRLDPAGDLLAQVRAALAGASGHAPGPGPAADPGSGPYADLADLAFDSPGASLARLRTAVYRLLDLPEPPTAAPVARAPRPEPGPPAAPVTSWRVSASLSAALSDGGEVHVVRIPAAVADLVDRAPGAHLACRDDEPDPYLTDSASVHLHRLPVRVTRTLRDTLDRHPGSLLAAAPRVGGGFLVAVRDGRVFEAAPTGRLPDAGIAAAVVHALLEAGTPPERDTLLTVRFAGPAGSAGSEDLALRLLS
ncbi:hypothetical protein OHS33_15305 [Streptomyces sp. NBC_00536]|uniref:hypothetical protein n=1 Tax=Streptomyces sp. NBC_00536 TaxID=2975769 RepID=UPI002E80260F|nr:hypothetical protein [Streptomyces sp. NBC_00536]WUC79571.1 hypothetical protein OHS33_15305 [Streptomyces sp. NBC_00536]